MYICMCRIAIENLNCLCKCMLLTGHIVPTYIITTYYHILHFWRNFKIEIFNFRIEFIMQISICIGCLDYLYSYSIYHYISGQSTFLHDTLYVNISMTNENIFCFSLSYYVFCYMSNNIILTVPKNFEGVVGGIFW